MLFSSLTFLLLFLPVVAGLYYVVPSVLKNAFLLVASLLFYAWGEPVYIGVMLLVIAISYLGALMLDKVLTNLGRKTVLVVTICATVGILFYFKYAGFMIRNVSTLTGVDIPFMEMILPIGISFYTFQALSYVFDVYRKEVTAQRHIFKLALYISLFPQLIAGPIVKYHDIYKQIDCREHTFDKFVNGLRRFVLGLAKKVLIANTLGQVADQIFALPVLERSPEIAWMGGLFYTLQLYFDFSGYSDMAIGLGAMFGFKFMENFNYPYVSKSVTEFWRRWHISLSTWFKHYVYIPLGGNRTVPWKIGRNLMVVFFLTGLWHGASWTFIVWGLYHGAFILFEKTTGLFSRPVTRLMAFVRHGYLLGVVLIGWIIFRSDTLSAAGDYLKALLFLDTARPTYAFTYYLTPWTVFIFGVALTSSTGVFKSLFWQTKSGIATLFGNTYILVLWFLCVMSLVGATYNPFIYFRF